MNNALICHPIPPSPTFSYSSAVLGLNSWKKQNDWLIQRDASKTTLIALLRLERALIEARTPEYWRQDFSSNIEQRDVSLDQKDFPTTIINRDHLDRLRKVQSAYEELEASMLSLEASWGLELRRECEAVEGWMRRFFSQVDTYLAGRQTGYLSEQHRLENEDVVFDSRFAGLKKAAAGEESEPNHFTRGFSIATTGLKRRLHSKLERSR